MKSRFGKHGRSLPLDDKLNVTPLVDVMLVLLIIFMVAAPMMHSGVSVDLPKSQNNPASQAPTKTSVIITLNKDGLIFVQDKPVTQATLLEELRNFPQEALDVLYLKADRTLTYEYVIQLMTALAAGGHSKVILINEVL